MPFRLVFLLSAGLLLSTRLTPVRADLPPLIPRTVLFGPREKSSPTISPDARHFAYLAPDKDGLLQVWVLQRGPYDAQQVTRSPKRGVSQYIWTYTPDTLGYLQDEEGGAHFHIANIRTKEDRYATPFSGVRAELIGVDQTHPDEVLLALNKDNPRSADVYRLYVATGRLQLGTKNPGDVISWTPDPQFRIRAAAASLPDGGVEFRFRTDEQSPWQTVARLGQEDAESTIVGFTPDGLSLWLHDFAERDTQGVVKRNLQAGREEVVLSEEGVDAQEVVYNAATHEVEAAIFNRERERWKVLDPALAKDLKVLETAAPGEVSILSRDRASRTWVVGYYSDTHPAEYYLYERSCQSLTHLFSSQPELARYTLAPMRPVTIKSRDGLDLVGYLTLPVGVEPKKLPMVLLVHGGPWGRDLWRLHPETQWLANRGYAVLSVNFRGSIGYGKKFLHAGDREWAGKMQDDLLDAVDWAVEKGYADPSRVAIYGISYGGYAALVGAVFTPDVFACAIDLFGPSNLVSFLKAFPPEQAALRKMVRRRLGDVDKDEEYLKSRSPLFKADRIKIPLLIAQGGKDPHVRPAESEQIVAAMRKAGRPVEYLFFPDEGHGFERLENRLKLFAAAEPHLSRSLGGRVEW
jgi:dipeptidyl aminopeptidase/acylaminoacyl peptidase